MIRHALTLLGVLAWLATAGCLPESSSASSDPFEVRGLDVHEDVPVPRNHEIQVVFTDSVDPTSFDDVTIQLLPGPDYDETVPLALDFSGHAALLRAKEASGLRPGTDYRLRLVRFPNLHAARRLRDDKMLDTAFHGRFRTSRDYVPERRPPEVRLEELRTDVHALGEIELRFSEALQPDVVSGEPFVLRDSAGDRPAGRFSIDLVDGGTRARFVPEYEVIDADVYTLTLDPELGDLAGNPVAGERQFVFHVDPSAAVDRLLFDLTHPFHAYRGEGIALTENAKAVRAASDPMGSAEFADVAAPTWTRGEGQRVQMLFRSEQIGDAGPLHRLYFETIRRPDAATVFDHVEIRLWHTDRTELSTAFSENRPFDGTARLAAAAEVHVETYPQLVVPSGGPHPFFPVDLSRPFAYDGRSNLVIEVLHFGGTETIESAGVYRGGAVNRIAGNPSDPEASSWDSAVDDVRFGIARTDRLVQWDRFEDLGSETAVAGRPVLSGNVPFVEDFVHIEYEAVPRASDGRSLDAPTPFTTDLADLVGHRYVRFRLTLLRDSVDGLPVELERLVIPID
jgi:hypothetical protein